MKRFGAFVLTAALAAGPAWAQSETELYESGGTALVAAQREVIQRNIDLATKALQAKDYKTARKYAQPVVRADPKRVESWLLLGTAQQGLQDWAGARKTYTTAVRLSPTHPEARAGLGIAYARTRDPKASVQLAWIDARLQDCGSCWQAGVLTRYKVDIEAAIRETAAATPAKGS
jgi:cytochrome c-type biogenesis protein CcmH/NrfG